MAFDFNLLGGLPHAEAQRVYSEANIIMNQILTDATGLLTLGVWALGKPVVVNLCKELFEPFYGISDLPVINADPDTIKDRLRQAIEDMDLSPDLAPRGRALVESRDAITKVIGQ